MIDYPSFALDGQVALVTGAARGSGARARSRWPTRAPTSRSACATSSTAGDLAEEIEALGRRALRLQMDVTDLDQVARAVDDAVAGLGRIDILVNNVGIGPENPAEDVRVEDFDDTVAVNLKGTFFVSQAVGRVMIEQGQRAHRQPELAGGLRRAARRVDLLHDQGGDRPPHQVPRRRVGHARHHRQRRRADVHRARRAPSRRSPTPRSGPTSWSASPRCTGSASPTDVAGAVVFLASPAASLITGETLLIDGGWTAR